MTLISQFTTKEQFFGFRDTVAKTLVADLSMNLKQRKLDEITAHLAGAADFNTALGMIAKNAAKADELSRCDNCLATWRFAELQPARDLDQRLDYPLDDPRCIIPEGECPDCGALCYAIKPDLPLQHALAGDLIRKDGEWTRVQRVEGTSYFTADGGVIGFDEVGTDDVRLDSEAE